MVPGSDVGFWFASTIVGEGTNIEVDIDVATETSLTADPTDLTVEVVAEDPDDDIDRIVGLLTAVGYTVFRVDVLPKNMDKVLMDGVEALGAASTRFSGLTVDDNGDG